MTMTDRTLSESTEMTPAARGKKKAAAASVTVAPVRTRRSGVWLAAAIAIILLGALGGAVLYANASNSTQVFVASSDIARGATIEKGDLTTISIANGQTTTAVPVADVDKLLGSIATVDIPAGGFITKTSVSPALEIPKGKALVGLTLKPSQMPAQQLRAGDNVVIVPIPAQGTAITDDVVADTITATISQVRPVPNTADTVVDVYVSSGSAAAVAAQAAAGTLAIYLVTEGE